MNTVAQKNTKSMMWMGMLAVLLLMLVEPANASSSGSIPGGGTAPGGTTADAPFESLLGMLVAWSTGALGKSFAIAAFLVGLGIGILKQSIVGFVVGMAMALVLAFGPGVIIGIFSATVPVEIAVASAAHALSCFPVG